MRKVAVLLAALAGGGCAHMATTPAENTALAVDSLGLAVDSLSFVVDHFLTKGEPPTTTLAFALADGGVMVVRAIEVTYALPTTVPAAPAVPDGGLL